MDVKQTLLELGYSNIKDSGDYYRTKPVYRDSDNETSLSVHKITGRFVDFGRNVKGSFEELVRLSLRVDKIEDAKEWLSDKTTHYTEAPKYVAKISEQKIFDENLLHKIKKDQSYWTKRGVSEETLDEFKGGTVDSGKMKDRYVFPIFNSKNKIVGFSGRDLMNYKNSHRPKWKHIGSKSTWVYPAFLNSDILLKNKKIIIVESIGDLLSLWDANIKYVIVSFGLDISSQLLNFLLKIDPNEVILSFNNDEANNSAGNKAADKAFNKLNKYFDPKQIKIILPDKKDFGEMNKEEILKWQKNI